MCSSSTASLETWTDEYEKLRRASESSLSPVKNAKTSALPVSLPTSAAAEHCDAREIFWMHLLQEKYWDLPVALLSSVACELAPLRIVLLCFF